MGVNGRPAVLCATVRELLLGESDPDAVDTLRLTAMVRARLAQGGQGPGVTRKQVRDALAGVRKHNCGGKITREALLAWGRRHPDGPTPAAPRGAPPGGGPRTPLAHAGDVSRTLAVLESARAFVEAAGGPRRGKGRVGGLGGGGGVGALRIHRPGPDAPAAGPWKPYHARFLLALWGSGAGGLTDSELGLGLGLTQDNARNRRRELVLLGLAEDSGATRKSHAGFAQTVWRVTAAGAARARALDAERKRGWDGD